MINTKKAKKLQEEIDTLAKSGRILDSRLAPARTFLTWVNDEDFSDLDIETYSENKLNKFFTNFWGHGENLIRQIPRMIDKDILKQELILPAEVISNVGTNIINFMLTCPSHTFLFNNYMFLAKTGEYVNTTRYPETQKALEQYRNGEFRTRIKSLNQTLHETIKFRNFCRDLGFDITRILIDNNSNLDLNLDQSFLSGEEVKEFRSYLRKLEDYVYENHDQVKTERLIPSEENVKKDQLFLTDTIEKTLNFLGRYQRQLHGEQK